MNNDKRIGFYFQEDAQLTELWRRFIREYREKYYKIHENKESPGTLKWISWLTEELRYINIKLINKTSRSQPNDIRCIILEFETAEDKTMFLMRWS